MMDRCVSEMLEQHSQKELWDKGTLEQSYRVCTSVLYSCIHGVPTERNV